MTGNSDSGSKCLTKSTESFIGCKVDLNLTATQTIMGIMNGIDTADDPSLENKVDQMRWFAGVGTAGPGIVAGTMLIVYRIAMSLFIGFAPIFILSLMFKKTAPLFQKWLYYGLATLFSSALLAVMADISMDLVSNISVALFTSNTAMELLTGDSASGVMYSVTQQLGLGLMLSTLLIVVPPMAGMWFNGVMGHFNAYSPLSDRWNANAPVPQHMDGGKSYQQQVENRVAEVRQEMQNKGFTNAATENTLANSQWTANRAIGSNSTPTEQIKTNSQIGNAVTPTVNMATQVGQQSIGASKPKTQKEEEV